jgi:hypothetical protein
MLVRVLIMVTRGTVWLVLLGVLIGGLSVVVPHVIVPIRVIGFRGWVRIITIPKSRMFRPTRVEWFRVLVIPRVPIGVFGEVHFLIPILFCCSN